MIKLKRMTAALIAAVLPAMCFGSAASVSAANPVVQTVYTADGAPMVWNDTFYLYTGHDEDNADYFTMNDWRCYSSADMQNWTDLGVPLDYKAFSWASGEAWAAQVVERGGKFYYYVTVTANFGGRAIGVAVADHPEGPFVDPLGKPLCGPDWSYIDPTVYVDDDGQAYLYWGNPKLWMVKLNEDMISYDGEPVAVDPGYEEYTEAPYLYKHNGRYYLVYASDGVFENISYSMSDSPTGPWTYCGMIMETGGNSFTNHPSIIDYKGHSYFTYHTGTLPGGSGFDRSMCIEEMYYDADGRIKEISRTDNGPKQIESLNPYQRNEAETICWEEGVETENCSAGGRNVCDMQNGEYIKVSGVDFGAGAQKFKVSASSALNGGTLELHLDKRDGSLIGTVPISVTGGWQNWELFACEITGAEGIHDLYFTFSGEGTAPLFNMDWWQFTSSAAAEYRKGDLNNDGIISAADLTLAKNGMMKGFADSAIKNAADIDENGKVDQKDIQWYLEYLTGQTKAFPKAENPVPAIDLSKYTAEFASVE
ncbi:MAG: family 43 glycosylhydrolase [Oscillospiraceae bacterium]|nr:family 43 glycosylhydrolase [Oscillospiraceae bacterium]